MSERKVGYYIYYEANTDFVGVKKKVDNQVTVLNVHFDCRKVIVPREKSNIFKSILWRLPFGSFGRIYEYVLDVLAREGIPDFLYIRFVPVDRRFLNFLRTIRSKYPETKILLEIATYPYARELLGNVSMAPFYFKDLCHRGKLKKYVDRIVTLTDDMYIYGIPTIRIINGIIVDDIPMIQDQNVSGKEINLIAVACFQPHHGYERCILGLKEYYEESRAEQIKIYLHMVGDGSEIGRYKKLVRLYNLGDYVTFYGQQSGENLNQIYKKADIALGSFGFYKIRVEKSSVLKVREYLSRGLPIVSACNEDVFQNNLQKFYLHIENNDSVVNMDLIVDFYKRLFSGGVDKEKMAEKIRGYAKRKVDMSITMLPIIEYINEG